MTYWKASTASITRASPFQPVHAISTTASDDTQTGGNELSRLTTLEIVVLVITFLAFIGQFINLAYALVDHGSIKRLTAEVRAIKPV